MATFNELMEAAGKAHKAGDTNAARILVQEAKRFMTDTAAVQRDAVTGQDMAMRPPNVENAFISTPDTVDRFGDTIGAAVEQPVDATKFYAGRTVAPGRNPAQRAGDAGLTALNALGSGVAFGAGLAGEVFGGSPTNELKLARDLMMAGSVAVPELAGVSSATRAATTARQAARRLDRAPSDVEAGARAADDLGITPSLSMTGRTGAILSAGLEKMPGSAALIARDANRAVAATEAEFRRISSRIGNARNAENAGEQLQGSLEQFVTKFEDTAKQLYDVVDAYVPPEKSITLDNSAALLRQTQALYRNNPELAKRLGVDEWLPIIDEVESNGIPWQAARDLRTRIGNAIGKKGDAALADKDTGDLKRLYAALSEDLEAGARAAGPRAANAWGRATRYYQAGRKRIDEALDKTITAKSPERAFEAFNTMMRQGASADIQRVRKIRASMSTDDWRDVSASIVDRLGRATAGAQNAAGDVFSPNTFLTNWDKLTPEGKRLLVPTDVREELDRLTQVMEAVRRGNAERNFSNTGTVGGAALSFGPLFLGDVATTAAITGGQFVSAKAMTSPVFLRAMNRGARGDMRDLNRLAGGKGPFAQDAATLMQIVGAQTGSGVGAANTNTRPVRAINQTR